MGEVYVCRLECDRCATALIVTYQEPTTILSIRCKCGHVTPIQKVPAEPAPQE